MGRQGVAKIEMDVRIKIDAALGDAILFCTATALVPVGGAYGLQASNTA